MKGICQQGKLKVITKVGRACLGGNGHQTSEDSRQFSQAPAEHYIQSMFKSKMLPNLPAERESASQSTIFKGLASIMHYIPIII
jgi:hypothetical protein